MPLRLALKARFNGGERPQRSENENESRFQRFFLSAMKPGALPQAKAKETARLARQTRTWLVLLSSSRFLSGS